MAEYIEREALVNVLTVSHSHHANNSREESLLARDIRLIREQPAADVALVVHGHIVPAEQPKKVLLDGKCVKCNSLMLSTDKFCSSCGARMDGE